MDIRDAQREVRLSSLGGFWGQLLYSILYFVAAALRTWKTPKASILTAVIAGSLIFPLVVLALRLEGCPPMNKKNPLYELGRQVAFVLPFSMLLLWPVSLYRLNWFFPALMILLGAHYLPFATTFGMRMFFFLAGILIAAGVVIALRFWVCSALAHGSRGWSYLFLRGLADLLRPAKPACRRRLGPNARYKSLARHANGVLARRDARFVRKIANC